MCFDAEHAARVVYLTSLVKEPSANPALPERHFYCVLFALRSRD